MADAGRVCTTRPSGFRRLLKPCSGSCPPCGLNHTRWYFRGRKATPGPLHSVKDLLKEKPLERMAPRGLMIAILGVPKKQKIGPSISSLGYLISRRHHVVHRPMALSI